MPKRILVADDSATIQKAFAMVFGGQDINLVVARSADEAMTSARHGRPDLVIADASLGSSNGYDLCAALKADPALRSVPVLILNSSHVPYDETRGQRAGAAGSLLKPFESQSLIDQVGAAMARVESNRAPGPVGGAVPHPAPPARETARVDAGAGDDDDYGEFTIERPRSGAPSPTAAARPAPMSAPSRAAPPAAAPTVPPAAAPALRPSLIPGVRPGAPLPQRVAPAPAAAVSPASLPPSVGLHRQTMGGGTIMGLPVVAPPVAPAAAQAPARAPAPVMRPAPAPAAPVQARNPAPGAAALPAAAAAISGAVAQKMAALAARGPEYEAIAKLSREIIEQVVWEVVPELAELIIRQEVDRLASSKR
jgi:CheY-like chemotaxis protein